MIEFKFPTLGDKHWIDKIVMLENSPSADYNFGNTFIWYLRYPRRLCRFDDRLLACVFSLKEPEFVYPIGTGPLRPAIEAMREYARYHSIPFKLVGITEKHKELLDKEYPNELIYSPRVNNADYVYEIQKLSTYSGKALHSKKNHCNRFEAEHSWEFLPITRELIPDCIEMLDKWTEDNSHRLHESIHHEHDALLRAFAIYEKLGLEGGVLKAEGKTIGFTMGERISSNCFDTHFEKADPNINGAYPMVCRELCRMLKERHEELLYINREEDMGLESLRKSKLSYKPAFMVNKYTARFIEDGIQH